MSILWQVTAGGGLPNKINVRMYDHTWSHVNDRHPEIAPLFDHLRETIINPSAIYDSSTQPGGAVLFFNNAVVDQKGRGLSISVKLDTRPFVTTACYRNLNYSGALLWKR